MKLHLRLTIALLAVVSRVPVFGPDVRRNHRTGHRRLGRRCTRAPVTATNVSTNASRQTVTTDTGDYSFPSLPPGTYTVRVEKPGFKVSESTNVPLSVQQSVRLDFTVAVGQVSESVSVEATPSSWNPKTATVGTVIDNKRIVELPLNGRNYLQLVALTPNATTLSPSAGQAGSRQGGDRAAQSISVAGQRIMFDNFTLDGVNNTDPNFNTYVVLPSIDALQEFKVQTGVYPAEFGRNSTQINVSTKPGGNTYHGALFEFLRNDKFDAKPYAFVANPPAKSPFKWNQYGFELDGPVRIPKLFNGRDRLFFMANYEVFRQRREFQRHLYRADRCDVRRRFQRALDDHSTIRPDQRLPLSRATSSPRAASTRFPRSSSTTTHPRTWPRRASPTTIRESEVRPSIRTNSSRAWISSSPRSRNGPPVIVGAMKTSPIPASRWMARKPSRISSSTCSRTRGSFRRRK